MLYLWEFFGFNYVFEYVIIIIKNFRNREMERVRRIKNLKVIMLIVLFNKNM